MGKSVVNMYRYFDGSSAPYKLVKYQLSKSDANRKAEDARRVGGKARVVKMADGYAVYAKFPKL